MIISKLLKKYREASTTFKATIWYTICNMLQKIAAFLIIPFLTRMLTTSDYGLYSVFLSWVDIIEILATMRIYSNGYVAGLIRNTDDKDRYTCSIQFISVVSIAICFTIFCIFSKQISELIQIERKYIYIMFLSFFATSSVGIWSSRQRVNNQYKLMVVVTLLYSVFAPILSIIGAYLLPNRLEAVIVVRVIAQFTISLPFFAMNIVGTKKGIALKYCKEALAYNIPLIPYYLSMVVLNSSDRIMIKRIVGEAEAGIYSVAYSLSMAVFVFVGALNLSLQPWIFNKLKSDSANGAYKTVNFATLIVAVLDMCVLIISPELIKMVASERYIEAIWTMPPIICSLLVIFIYQQFLNINFYFGENKTVFMASMIAAGFNLLLNTIFIHLYGYIAAGYTTLISYLVIALLYYFSMKRISNIKGINYKEYFDIPFIVGTVVLFGCLTVIITLLYPYPFIRYIFVISIIVVIILMRKHFFAFLENTGLFK